MRATKRQLSLTQPSSVGGSRLARERVRLGDDGELRALKGSYSEVTLRAKRQAGTRGAHGRYKLELHRALAGDREMIGNDTDCQWLMGQPQLVFCNKNKSFSSPTRGLEN